MSPFAAGQLTGYFIFAAIVVIGAVALVRAVLKRRSKAKATRE